ncbi:probable 3-hydroxyisobutyrate dehydrogenase, mitochondrial, partial [Tanacetum coccineum]
SLLCGMLYNSIVSCDALVISCALILFVVGVNVIFDGKSYSSHHRSLNIPDLTVTGFFSVVSPHFDNTVLYSWDTPIMLDAPVSGGVPAAENGTLTFMVGGPEEAYKAAGSLFSFMGKNTIYCGSAGTGSAAKICNNLAMAVSMLGVSEAFVLGQSLGITATTLTKIFNSSSARCWSSDTYNPVPGVMDGVPSSRNYDGGFASTLMAKDLNLASASVKEIGLKCPLTSDAKDM